MATVTDGIKLGIGYLVFRFALACVCLAIMFAGCMGLAAYGAHDQALRTRNLQMQERDKAEIALTQPKTVSVAAPVTHKRGKKR